MDPHLSSEAFLQKQLKPYYVRLIGFEYMSPRARVCMTDMRLLCDPCLQLDLFVRHVACLSYPYPIMACAAFRPGTVELEIHNLLKSAKKTDPRAAVFVKTEGSEKVVVLKARGEESVHRFSTGTKADQGRARAAGAIRKRIKPSRSTSTVHSACASVAPALKRPAAAKVWSPVSMCSTKVFGLTDMENESDMSQWSLESCCGSVPASPNSHHVYDQLDVEYLQAHRDEPQDKGVDSRSTVAYDIQAPRSDDPTLSDPRRDLMAAFLQHASAPQAEVGTPAPVATQPVAVMDADASAATMFFYSGPTVSASQRIEANFAVLCGDASDQPVRTVRADSAEQHAGARLRRSLPSVSIPEGATDFPFMLDDECSNYPERDVLPGQSAGKRHRRE